MANTMLREKDNEEGQRGQWLDDEKEVNEMWRDQSTVWPGESVSAMLPPMD